MTAIQPSDLCILITGGARGIGAETARDLAEAGAKVMITDVLDEEGEALAAELGANVQWRRLDVTDSADWEEAVAATVKAFGRMNALFNNAGIVSFSPVDRCSPEDFQRVIDINLTGVFLGIRHGCEAIKQAGGGVIVNNSSTAGLQGYGGIAAYVASKWGVRGLTKAAALDLAPFNIRVLSLHPGPIRTPMTKDMGEATVEAQPMPRFGEPLEVARMVRFMLCEASFSTGT
ncbi:MAG: SDR family NAD(P)-dependent oxidoreductase, partial [Nitratireductor sp.]|nr:SDR family NAD(P)-dependent oxidoreductase [Nitratireductor sp.]